MAIRIRVYPAGAGAYGAYGMNGYGGAVSASTYYNSKLTAAKQVSNLQLGYERALADERINRVRLEERLKNPYLQTGMLGAYGLGGLGSMGMLGALGGLGSMGTMLPATSMLPLGFGGGGGQINVTNQTSPGSGNQTVTNSNVNNVSSSFQQPLVTGGWGGGGWGGGGLLSGLLGALI